MLKTLPLILLGIAASPPAWPQSSALQMIEEAANSICTTPPMEQSRNKTEISVGLDVKVQKLIESLLKAGFDVSGKYSSDQSKGVLQSELAAAIKDSNQCKLQVFMTLSNRLLVSSGRIDPEREQIVLESLKQSAPHKFSVLESSGGYNPTLHFGEQLIRWLRQAGWTNASRSMPPAGFVGYNIPFPPMTGAVLCTKSGGENAASLELRKILNFLGYPVYQTDPCIAHMEEMMQIEDDDGVGIILGRAPD